MRHSPIMLTVLASCVFATQSATAGVPSAANSFVEPCMVLCPLGDIPFTVIVRDLANNPLNGSSVVLDFSFSPSAVLCPAIPTDPYLINPVARTIRAFTGVDGRVTFPARIGGTGAGVRVYANGLLIAERALASPDQDGNGIVDPGIDGAAFAAKLGTHDDTADYDCAGFLVDAADQAIQAVHVAHTCAGIVVPTRHSTWGAVKLHYR